MAITIGQTVGSGSNAESQSLAFGSNVTDGSLLFAACRDSSGTGAATTAVTDTRSNTWVEVIKAASEIGTLQLYRTKNAGTGANTVSFDSSENVALRVAIGEATGTFGASPLVLSSSATGDSTTPAASASLVTTGASTLLVSVLGSTTDTVVTSAGSGWSTPVEGLGRVWMSFKLVAAGTHNADWAWSSGGQEITTLIASFVEDSTTTTTFRYHNGGILAGSTGVTTYAYLQTTAGAASTGVAFGSITASYTRQGGALVPVTLSAGTPGGAWGAGKFIEVDATNCPGLYRIDWPDAAFIAGAAESVTLSLKGTGLRPCHDQQPLQLDQAIWGGEAITGATQTEVPTAGLPTLSAGQLNRRLLQFLSGPCAGQRVLIVGQTSGNVLQVAPPLTAAPSDGDGFCIL